jgi:hypothetical protein
MDGAGREDMYMHMVDRGRRCVGCVTSSLDGALSVGVQMPDSHHVTICIRGMFCLNRVIMDYD